MRVIRSNGDILELTPEEYKKLYGEEAPVTMPGYPFPVFPTPLPTPCQPYVVWCGTCTSVEKR